MHSPFAFDATASRPKRAVALIYDLEGFSRFFNQPDVQDYVPQFLNTINRALSIMILGGKTFWGDKEDVSPLSLQPAHYKFLGDGGLCLWVERADQKITTSFVAMLCNRLWNVQNRFEDILKTSHDHVPVVDIPKKIRFGIARGTVYELRHKGSRHKEYIGFCINLASRLQKYCPELGFIASARIGMNEERLVKYGYMRVVAKAIRGFPQEIVIVDKDEYEELPPDVRAQLFGEI
jgi:class 3 adenylate cyclase